MFSFLTRFVALKFLAPKHRAGAVHIPSASGTNPDRTRRRMVAPLMPALGADVFLFHLVAEPSAGNGRRFVDCVTPGLVELAAALGPTDDGITCTEGKQWYARRKEFQYQRANARAMMHGGYDHQRDRGWTNLEWFLRDGSCWRRRRERIEQVAWTAAEMSGTLRKAGFDRISAFDATPFFTGDPQIRPGCRTFY